MEGKIKSSVQTLTCEPPFKDTSRPAKEAVAYLNLGSKTAEMQIQIWALPFSRFSSYLPSQPGIHFTLLNCCCLPFGPAFSLPYQINTAHSRQIRPLETKIWSFLSFDKKNSGSYRLWLTVLPSTLSHLRAWILVPLRYFPASLICHHSSLGGPSLPPSFLHTST